MTHLTPITNPGGSDAQVQYNNNGVFGGAAQLFWDDVNDRLGVNESSPGGMFHIQTSGIGVIGQIIKATASQTEDLFRITDSADGVLVVVDESGNVGFGTQNPFSKLDIQGGNLTIQNGRFIRWSSASDVERASILVDTSDNLIFNTTSAVTERMRIAASGNVGIGMVPNEKLQVDDAIAISSDAEGSTARLTRRTTHETHTLSLATTSDTTTMSIPSGARLLGVSMNVNTAVTDDAGDDTWSAAFITGSTTTIVTGASAALDTKVDFIVPDEKTTAVAQIQFTPNAGSFSAGIIEIVAYYEELTSLADV